MEQQRPCTVSGIPSRPARRRWFQSCRVRPTTVCPWACSIAATVEESTPPDMAIAMVWFCIGDFTWVRTGPTFHDKWSAGGTKWWKSGGYRLCRLKELGVMVEQSKIASKGALGGRWALPFLGVACAVGVASLYYN